MSTASTNTTSSSHLSPSSVFYKSSTSQTTLSAREQRAIRRKEKSRLAAKMRRHQESQILSSLLQALPVSFDFSPRTPGMPLNVKAISTALSLEKSGVIRMAGQSLFLFNSLAQHLGTKSAPVISLLSRSLYGLLANPNDSTVVYATPSLAEAINWPWINLIGVTVDMLLDNDHLPSRVGETVRLRRLLEQATPLSRAPTLTCSPQTATTTHLFPSNTPHFAVSGSPSDAASTLWSPHLYRCNKDCGSASGQQSTSTVASTSPAIPTAGNRLDPYLLCSCFALLRVPSSPLTSHETTTHLTSTSSLLTTTSDTPRGHLLLYLLQPTPPVCTEAGAHLPQTPTPNEIDLPLSTSFQRTRERYLFNRQRRLILQSPQQSPPPPPPSSSSSSSVPIEGRSSSPSTYFSTFLDRALKVKCVENCNDTMPFNFASMVGQSFLDFIAIPDLPEICRLLTECVQRNSPKWTPVYHLRIPCASGMADLAYNRSEFVLMRSLFILTSNAFNPNIRCLHQLIGNAQTGGLETWFLQSKPLSSLTSLSRLSSTSSSTYPVNQSYSSAAAAPKKRPVKLLRIQPVTQQRQPQNHPNLTLQPISTCANFGPYLTPLVAKQPNPVAVALQSSQVLGSQMSCTAGNSSVYLRRACVPQPIATKTITTYPSIDLLVADEKRLTDDQSSLEIFYLQPSKLSPVQQTQQLALVDKPPNVAWDLSPNLSDILQELGPETLAMLEESENFQSDSLPTNLSFDDILSPMPAIAEMPNSEVNYDNHLSQTSPDSISSSSASLSESVASYFSSPSFNSTASSTRQSQHHRQQEIPVFRNGDVDLEMLSDADDFWNALVSNVMNLPLDNANLSMDVC